MDRTFEISTAWFAYLLYASMLSALLALLLSPLVTRGGFASVTLGALFAFLVLATLVGVWREKTDREAEHLGTTDDVVYDPLAPGQMAKERWRQSIRLFAGGDDDED